VNYVHEKRTKSAFGPPFKNENKILCETLNHFYQEKFKKYSGYDKKDLVASKITYILGYSQTQMVTSYNNLILTSFIKKFNHYINCILGDKNKIRYEVCETKKESDDLKKIIRKELHAVKYDILNGTMKSNEQYHNWINNNRNKLVPLEFQKSVNYDITKKPQKYLKYLIYMNTEIERLQKKQINVFPLKRSLVPSYITLDTSGLLELLYDKGTKPMRDNISYYKNLIWNTWFNLENKCFKMSKSSKYKFDHTIMTDGIGVSIRFSDNNDIYKKSVKLREEKKKKDNGEKQKIIFEKKEVDECEFKYITELTRKDLDNLKNKNRIYIDPNCGNIIYALDEDKNKIFRYTRSQRKHETGRNKHKAIVDDIKYRTGMNYMESEISHTNSKSCNYEKFRQYTKFKNKNALKGMSDIYEKEIFRKLKLREKINTQRSESKLLNNLKRIYGEDSIVCFGDCNETQQLKGTAPTPHIGIKRLLKREFKVYYVDEFRTSILNCMCCQRSVATQLAEQ
jgi:hypothetical protein